MTSHGLYSIRRAILFFTVLAPLLGQQLPQKEDDDAQAERQQWFYSQRVYPRGSIPAGARIDAIRRIQQNDAAIRLQHQALRAASPNGASTPAVTMDSVNWTLIGPKPTDPGSSSTSGRVNAIAIDPRDSNTVYIGAAEGGVWKTRDGGVNWTPLTDAQPSLATGAIVLDPNDPNVVYVGTGEENFAVDSYYGAGILKSTDGGTTWTNIVGPFLRDRIGAIAIQPGNSQVLLCASTQGVWRSANGGATWSSTLAGTAAISVVFDPTNGASAYASLGNVFGNTRNGVYHSTDGGLTWKASGGTGTTALPTTDVGRIEIAMAPSDPATIYVQIQNVTTNGLLGIYKTTDGGSTWNKLPITNASIWGTQLWYDNTIRVHPTNPNLIWSGAFIVYRSRDGGNTWTQLSQIDANGVQLHVDTHFLAFTPDGNKLYIANDGGVYSTTDVSVASVNWTSLNSTLAITQFYPGMSTDPSNPQISVGGSQDNSTQRYAGDLGWETVACGDGGYTAVDPAFPALAYSACQRISIVRSLGVTGASTWVSASYGIDQTDATQFISPFTIDPSNPQTLYFGTFRLWQSRDSAGRWNPVSPDLTGGNKGTLKAIAVAPADSNTVYIGTSNSKVQVTTDVGDGASAVWTDRSAGLPLRTVTQIAVDPIDSALAYVTFSGFNGGADQQGHVFKTTNSGATWNDISGNLPNIPVNDAVVDPDIPQTLYIATDAGVMVTTDGGAAWSTLGNGLPKVVVNSLVLHRRSRILRAATHGRSVWDILVPLPPGSQRPVIASISPSSANAGDAAFTLNVTGSGFSGGTVVRWNGQKRSTAFVDSGHLTVQIPASDIALLGRASVLAFTPASGGGASNSAAFIIGPGPQTATKGFVSAANPLSGNALASRSIASLYGLNLAPGTFIADLAPPLPSTLGGTTLTMLSGGQSVPLFFVSPNQINFQVPRLTPPGPQTLTITQGVQSISIPVTLVAFSPALFTTNSQGTGQASTLIANTVAIAAPVGAFSGSRPAKIGEFLSIYCTGLGDVSNQPGLGSPSPSNPLASTLTKPLLTIGGVAATVAFSGLAPGYVGLYQVNAQVPDTAPTGAAVPMVLTIGGVVSNTATIAIDPAR